VLSAGGKLALAIQRCIDRTRIEPAGAGKDDAVNAIPYPLKEAMRVVSQVRAARRAVELLLDVALATLHDSDPMRSQAT
jgi:hypothetical protein